MFIYKTMWVLLIFKYKINHKNNQWYIMKLSEHEKCNKIKENKK